MQANKLGWAGLLVMAGMTACGIESADVTSQPSDSSEATLQQNDTPYVLDDDAAFTTKPGCPPAQGNTKGVGGKCTRGGGQCKGTGAPFCTVDVSSSTQFAFCTKVCFSNDQCGAGATCASNPRSPGMRGCVPNACL